jgi:hypothetical protein
VVGNNVGECPKGVWPEKNAKISQVAKVNNYQKKITEKFFRFMFFFFIIRHIRSRITGNMSSLIATNSRENVKIN